MRPWQDWMLLARLALLAALVWLVLDGLPHIVAWRQRTYGAPPPKRFEPYDWVDPAKGLGIIFFYASPGAVKAGEPASVCYGVMNAHAVSIEPAVAQLTPSLNRCLQMTPRKTTRYTLTAEDGKGGKVSQSLVLTVGAGAGAR
jgi:hypothetical protein